MMSDKPKKSQTTPQDERGDKSDINFLPQLTEILQVLHKHLPNTFPKIEFLDETRDLMSVVGIGRVNITIDGELLQITPADEVPDAVHDLHLLLRFLSRYVEDKSRNLWISGLPWGFNGEEFYRTYVKELGHKITTEMLSKIGFDKGACERYKSKYKDIIKKSRFEIFQDQIVEYRKNQKYNSFKLDFILKELNSDVTLSEINEWQQQTLFKKTITIDFKKNKIWIWSE